jgi:hypothetical protein
MDSSKVDVVTSWPQPQSAPRKKMCSARYEFVRIFSFLQIQSNPGSNQTTGQKNMPPSNRIYHRTIQSNREKNRQTKINMLATLRSINHGHMPAV